MPELTVPALRTQLTSGTLMPLYVLTGHDEVEKDELVAEFGAVVEEDLRAFNLDRLYGGEIDVGRLEACANTLPMLAPRRVVLVLEAEKLLVPKRESQAADEAQARLETFIAAPPSHAVVVFVCAAAPDQRRRVVKRLWAEAQVVVCGVVTDPELWVKTRAARDGVRFDAGAVRALAARAGTDVARLRAGFDRVVLYAMDAPAITAADVQTVVPPGPEAQEHFGIANAIADGDAAEALRQLGLVLDAGAAPLMVLGQVRYAIEKLPAPRLPAAVEALLRTDLAMKSSGPAPRALLERLVFEVCGGRKVRRPGGPSPRPRGPVRR